MPNEIDRFSDVADRYARYRPGYPDHLYSYLLSHVRSRELAWDAGTGNGQVAGVLTKSFSQVIGTDISKAQLAQALTAENIRYIAVASERSGIASSSVNLITVAQAVHWFDLEAFTAEVKRVSAPDGVLAVWGYSLLRIREDIDALIDHLYHDILHGYWDVQRTYLDRQYRDLYFPFDELVGQTFEMPVHRDVAALKGYLRTWSAVSRYRQRHARDPVSDIEEALDAIMLEEHFLCKTPAFLRIWRVR